MTRNAELYVWRSAAIMLLAMMWLSNVSAQDGPLRLPMPPVAEDRREDTALQLVAESLSALNPSQHAVPQLVIIQGTRDMDGHSQRFEQRSSGWDNYTAEYHDQNSGNTEREQISHGSFVRLRFDGQTEADTDARALQPEPLNPYELLRHVADDTQTGIVLGKSHPDAHSITITLFLHTRSWTPQALGQTREITLVIDSGTHLPLCELSLRRYDGNITHTIPEKRCYQDYRTESGLMFPHTIVDIRGGRLNSTSRIQSVSVQ